MSSVFACLSSTANRLGHGIVRRMTTSTAPRKAIAPVRPPRTAPHHGQPCTWARYTISAGLVSSATMVATRDSLRSWARKMP